MCNQCGRLCGGIDRGRSTSVSSSRDVHISSPNVSAALSKSTPVQPATRDPTRRVFGAHDWSAGPTPAARVTQVAEVLNRRSLEKAKCRIDRRCGYNEGSPKIQDPTFFLINGFGSSGPLDLGIPMACAENELGPCQRSQTGRTYLLDR